MPTSGQCGGDGFTGSTCCATGSTCVETNEYYSQCLPGTASSSSSAAASSSTSTKASSTVASTTKTTSAVATGTATGASSTATYSGNPFSGVQQWANSYYASEISAYAIPTLSAAQASQAAEVAKVPTFQWLYVGFPPPPRKEARLLFTDHPIADLPIATPPPRYPP